MHIKILVKENEKKDLERFIETCKQHGFTVIREGGGKIPNWSGWFAELIGERWQKDATGERQSNIPDVNQQRELLAAFKEDYNNRNFEDSQIADQDIELFLAASDKKETPDEQSNCIEADVSVSLLERAEMLISDTHEHWHNDYNRWRNER